MTDGFACRCRACAAYVPNWSRVFHLMDAHLCAAKTAPTLDLVFRRIAQWRRSKPAVRAPGLLLLKEDECITRSRQCTWRTCGTVDGLSTNLHVCVCVGAGYVESNHQVDGHELLGSAFCTGLVGKQQRNPRARGVATATTYDDLDAICPAQYLSQDLR